MIIDTLEIPADIEAMAQVETLIDTVCLKLGVNEDYYGNVLIAVTEAPNSNIIKWNSQVRIPYGAVRKMVSTGYHKLEVWQSILFQLLYACMVLNNNKIYFNNFSLENNVYIKDVQTDNTGNSCWIYRINDIDYYVPNYGYIVVIDSNFADI